VKAQLSCWSNEAIIEQYTRLFIRRVVVTRTGLLRRQQESSKSVVARASVDLTVEGLPQHNSGRHSPPISDAPAHTLG
jgi:hypothetical protein